MPDTPAAGSGDEPRLPLLHPDSLDAAQREIYDSITARRGSGGGPAQFIDETGRLLGPFNAMLHSPAVGNPLQALGAAVRFATGFTKREREIAILTVAAHQRSGYEWYAHARIGARAGVTEPELDALRTGGDPELSDTRERLVHAATRRLAADGDLDETLYDAVAAELGHATLVELVTLVGYYSALALQLRVFRVGLPDGVTPPDWQDDDPA